MIHSISRLYNIIRWLGFGVILTLIICTNTPVLSPHASGRPIAAVESSINADIHPTGGRGAVVSQQISTATQAPPPTCQQGPSACAQNLGGTLWNQTIGGIGNNLQLMLLPGDFGKSIVFTPPEMTYGNKIIQHLHDGAVGVALSALALILGWNGLSMITGKQTGLKYHKLAQLLPRVVLIVFAITSSMFYVELNIDMNNAINATVIAFGREHNAHPELIIPEQVAAESATPNHQITYAGAGGVPVRQASTDVSSTQSIDTAPPSSGNDGWLQALYFILFFLLVIQMALRLAFLDVMIVIAPLALIFWLVKQYEFFTILWYQVWSVTTAMQVLQVICLTLGASLAATPTFASTGAIGARIVSGHTFIVPTTPNELLLAIGVIWTALCMSGITNKAAWAPSATGGAGLSRGQIGAGGTAGKNFVGARGRAGEGFTGVH